jgi:hypothetical protein
VLISRPFLQNSVFSLFFLFECNSSLKSKECNCETNQIFC